MLLADMPAVTVLRLARETRREIDYSADRAARRAIRAARNPGNVGLEHDAARAEAMLAADADLYSRCMDDLRRRLDENAARIAAIEGSH